MPSLTEITNALHARKCGSGWLGRCPAHQDASPSLSIRERDGKILVHCFGGCSQDDVITALRSRGLWTEQSKTGERPARITDDSRDDARRARYWAHSARLLADRLLDELPQTDPDRLPLTRLLASLKKPRDKHLVPIYREHRRRDAAFTAGLVCAGRLSIVRTEEWLAAEVIRGFHE